VIDQETQALVLEELNKVIREKCEIERIEEKPYGWVFYAKLADGKPFPPGGCTCAVLEKENRQISILRGSFMAVALGKFEENLFWQTRYDAILAQISRQEWDAAQLAINDCLETSRTISAQRERSEVTLPFLDIDGARESVSFSYAILFMTRLGEVLLHKGKDEEAETIFLQAKHCLDKAHPLTVHTHAADKRVPLLQNLIAQQMKRQERRLADDYRRELGRTYLAARQDDKAQQVFEEQLQKRSEIYPSGHPAVAQTLTDLAKLKIDQGQHYEADIFFEKAVERWDWLLEIPERLPQLTELTDSKSISDYQNQACETMKHWAASLRARGRSDEAKRLMEKIDQLQSKV